MRSFLSLCPPPPQQRTGIRHYIVGTGGFLPNKTISSAHFRNSDSVFPLLIHFSLLKTRIALVTWVRKTTFDGQPGVISKLKILFPSNWLVFEILHQSLFSWPQGLDLVILFTPHPHPISFIGVLALEDVSLSGIKDVDYIK